MDLKDVSFTIGSDTMVVNDSIGGGVRMTSQVVGSNSENDDFANHFLQGIQLSDEMTIRTFDLAASIWLRSQRGKIAQVSMTIPHASEGSSTTDILLHTSVTSDSGALIQSVTFDNSKDKEGEAEISLIFRCKSSGMNGGLTMTEVTGS